MTLQFINIIPLKKNLRLKLCNAGDKRIIQLQLKYANTLYTNEETSFIQSFKIHYF